jgi:hypothetical protein
MNIFVYGAAVRPQLQASESPRRDDHRHARRWLAGLTAIYSLLCCAWVSAASAPLPNERVGTGIQINTIRNLQIDANTEVFIDGLLETGPISRERVGTGKRIRGVLGADANPDLTAGTLTQIWIDQELMGVVTALAPLQIMGQSLVVNADTVLEGLTDVAQLAIGDNVDVSAYFDSNGSAVASRLVKRAVSAPPTRWRISGFLTALNVTASEANVGAQPIRFVGVLPAGCAATPLAIGSFVELRADPISGFVPGQRIDSVTELRCATTAPFGTVGSAGAIEAVISTVGASQFAFGNVSIEYDSSTEYVRGTQADLAVGARVEVAGTFSSANVLQATRIFFVQPLLRVRAPLAPADVVIGISATALGEVFLANSQLRDDDGVFAGGLGAPRHVELRAYIDRDGQLFGLRSRIRDNAPLPNEIELSGPVGTINRPNFNVLGIAVLTGAGTIYLDAQGATIDADTFFAQLVSGASVEATMATYNAGTRELIPAVVQIGDAAPPQVVRSTNGGAVAAVVQGTVTLFDPETLFVDGFEN